MKWKTSVSHVNKGKEVVRGVDLDDLIKEKTFGDVIFLILRGMMPTKKESVMLNAMLIAAIDHGIGTTSAMTARMVASAKNSMHTAVAAGILAMGEAHGGAIEGAAKFFQEYKAETDISALVKRMKEAQQRIPGYGHAVLTKDERSETLFALAKKEGVYGEHCAFAIQVHQELNAQSSKPLPLNIDGAMAAILSDMGFDWKMTKGVFIIARVPGLVAHVYEELTEGEGLRRLSEEEIVYEGNNS